MHVHIYIPSSSVIVTFASPPPSATEMISGNSLVKSTVNDCSASAMASLSIAMGIHVTKSSTKAEIIRVALTAR